MGNTSAIIKTIIVRHFLSSVAKKGMDGVLMTNLLWDFLTWNSLSAEAKQATTLNSFYSAIV